MSHQQLIRPGAAALVLLLLVACASSQEPSDDGDGAATLSGTIRSAATSAALADARVSIGTRQAISDADGSFELTGVPTGTATVRAERPGYTAAEATVSVTAGTNTRNFMLTPREIYETSTGAVFVPAGVAPLRGAIVILGGPVASGFVTGDRLTPATTPPELEPSLQSLGGSLRALARASGVALFGSRTPGLDNSTVSDNALFTALESAADSSGHPELADAPLLLFGLSAGAREAAGLASRHPGRTIGLLLRVPADVTALTAPAALAVPAFVMQAKEDAAVNNFAVQTKAFENRSRGGLWALAVEPDIGHQVATERGNGAVISWIRIALGLRLPATPGDPLLTLDDASGWLGNQSTLEIAPWADYVGSRADASWLLSEAAASSWQSLGTAASGE